MTVALSCAAAPAESAETTFRPVHIFVDSGPTPLAAYQLEFSVTNRSAKIVGIEGGEHPAFAAPPYYDPKAIQQERVIIAAFSTNAVTQLPTGKARVATIHIQVTSPLEPRFELNLSAAADPAGNRILAAATAEQAIPRTTEGGIPNGGIKQ